MVGSHMDPEAGIHRGRAAASRRALGVRMALVEVHKAQEVHAQAEGHSVQAAGLRKPPAEGRIRAVVPHSLEEARRKAVVARCKGRAVALHTPGAATAPLDHQAEVHRMARAVPVGAHGGLDGLRAAARGTAGEPLAQVGARHKGSAAASHGPAVARALGEACQKALGQAACHLVVDTHARVQAAEPLGLGAALSRSNPAKSRLDREVHLHNRLSSAREAAAEAGLCRGSGSAGAPVLEPAVEAGCGVVGAYGVVAHAAAGVPGQPLANQTYGPWGTTPLQERALSIL